MPSLEFKGKQFFYSHHLSVLFRELQAVAEKSLPATGLQGNHARLFSESKNQGKSRNAAPKNA